ncbi:MAG: hypothetical protein VSS75_015070 [Candidatus Parabeggiatoa sp.]|nr:hypothetical protein [Candidatus Parabeggiatoa sp.]
MLMKDYNQLLFYAKATSYWTFEACGDDCYYAIYFGSGDEYQTRPNTCPTYGVRAIRSKN